IRDDLVTGVQTCALPISASGGCQPPDCPIRRGLTPPARLLLARLVLLRLALAANRYRVAPAVRRDAQADRLGLAIRIEVGDELQIGRASCREGVWMSVDA